MKEKIGLGLSALAALGFFCPTASAYTINLDTEYVPDAWHFEIVERLGYSSIEQTYVNGVVSSLDTNAYQSGGSNLNFELGMGNGTSLSLNLPYQLKGAGTAATGMGDASLGFAKQVVALPFGGLKSKVRIAMPGAKGINSYGLGFDNSFTMPLGSPQFLLSSNLNYYYPFKKSVAVPDSNAQVAFAGDRVQYGLGLEYWVMPNLTLSLEAFGLYKGISKLDESPLAASDGKATSNNVFSLAPGLTIALGPSFAIQGSFIAPVLRSGDVGPSPSYSALLSTILDF